MDFSCYNIVKSRVLDPCLNIMENIFEAPKLGNQIMDLELFSDF